MFNDLVRVLDFLPRAELIDYVAEEPFDELSDEHRSWELLLLAEIYELALQTPTHSAPFVLFDELRAIYAEGKVVPPQFQELGNHRLKFRRDAYCLLYSRVQFTLTNLVGG